MVTKGKFHLYTYEEFELFTQWIESLIPKRPIKLIQNHHTYAPDYKSWAKLPDHFHWLESMERFQIQSMGFAQIAQNLTTFPDGSIAVCRPMDIIPAGIKGANSYGICMEHFGNFDTGGDAMSERHRECILDLNALLCKKFNLCIDTSDIVYHHWYDLETGQRTNGVGTVVSPKDGARRPTSVKTCPGTNFFGGNSVEACEKNFLPLVTQAMTDL